MPASQDLAGKQEDTRRLQPCIWHSSLGTVGQPLVNNFTLLNRSKGEKCSQFTVRKPSFTKCGCRAPSKGPRGVTTLWHRPRGGWLMCTQRCSVSDNTNTYTESTSLQINP